MAKGDLKKVLEELNTKLEKDSEAYRTLVANKQAHYLVLDQEKLKKQIQNQLEAVEKKADSRFSELSIGFKQIIEREVPKMFDYLADKLDPVHYQSQRRKYLTESYSNSGGVLTVVIEVKQGKPPGDVFAYFRRIKQRSQKNLVAALNKEIQRLNKQNVNQRQEVKPSDFLDIGHVGESAVSKQRKAEVERTLFQFSQQQNPMVRKFIKELAGEVELKIRRVPSKKKVGGKEVNEITLESTRLNKAEGQELKKLAGEINEKLEKLIAALDPTPAELSGSPTYVERAEQQAINRMAEVATKARAKKNFKKKKLDKKTSTASVKRKSKASAGEAFNDKTKAPAIKMGSDEGRKQSPINLMTLINAKLPATVRKNMGPPRLENQTGRFASSVRMVDATLTPQGFPSLGYTYQRQPYGVFESTSGSRFASVERDPRTLIDKSIREIAAELVTMRLYTRRV